MRRFPTPFPAPLSDKFPRRSSDGVPTDAFGFIPIGSNSADLIVEDGVDVLLTINGTAHNILAADLAALPHNLQLPVIAGLPQVQQDLTGTPGVWAADWGGSLTPVFDWRRDGVSTGAVALVYSVGQPGTYVLRETVNGEWVESNAIVVAASDDWNLTALGGGVLVNAKPTPPAPPIIASTGNASVTIG